MNHGTYGQTIDNVWNQGTTVIENVAVTGNFQGGSGYNGAIGGTLGGPVQIKNVYAQATVNGYNANRTAGLVGRVSKAIDMQNAYFYGDVTVEGAQTYALIGQNTNADGANACTFNNMVNFSTLENTYAGAMREGVDAISNIYNTSSASTEELCKTVIAFDPELWVEGDETTNNLPTFSWLKGKADGINGVVLQSEGTIYDLQGRRVMKANKGIYIMNGQKVLVK